MVRNINQTSTSVQYILEDNLPDPYNGTRVGSLVFDNTTEINFNKYMPKLQVFPERVETRELSFGTPGRMRTNEHTINIVFLTRQGELGSGTALKDRKLVQHYLQLIEDTLLTYSGSITGATIVGFGTVDNIPFDSQNGVYIGIKPVVLLLRQ